MSTLKSLGRTPAGCPRMTNNREFSFLKLWSKSSSDSSKNLEKKSILDENKVTSVFVIDPLTSIY